MQTASAPLAGVDFNIHGLNLTTEPLGNGYAKVTINAGTFSAATHKAQFSPLMQKVLRESDDNSAQSDLAKLAEDDDLPTFVVAVRRDGRWYVSAAYTVLEYVREYLRAFRLWPFDHVVAARALVLWPLKLLVGRRPRPEARP